MLNEAADFQPHTMVRVVLPCLIDQLDMVGTDVEPSQEPIGLVFKRPGDLLLMLAPETLKSPSFSVVKDKKTGIVGSVPRQCLRPLTTLEALGAEG